MDKPTLKAKDAIELSAENFSHSLQALAQKGQWESNPLHWPKILSTKAFGDCPDAQHQNAMQQAIKGYSQKVLHHMDEAIPSDWKGSVYLTGGLSSGYFGYGIREGLEQRQRSWKVVLTPRRGLATLFGGASILSQEGKVLVIDEGSLHTKQALAEKDQTGQIQIHPLRSMGKPLGTHLNPQELSKEYDGIIRIQSTPTPVPKITHGWIVHLSSIEALGFWLHERDNMALGLDLGNFPRWYTPASPDSIRRRKHFKSMESEK
ncbi:MAG: hypothetical protein MI717_12425 [Spirochaetales bacterium]|nr:hypothetical protein [Spirochaetales bacterium]